MTNGRILTKKNITQPLKYQIAQENKIRNILNGILLGKILLQGVSLRNLSEPGGKEKSVSSFEDKLYAVTEKNPLESQKPKTQPKLIVKSRMTY